MIQQLAVVFADAGYLFPAALHTTLLSQNADAHFTPAKPE
jgi:hypothetical protein